MGQRTSKCKDPEAAVFCKVFDNSREARVAGEWLDCNCNKTSLVRKLSVSGWKRKACSFFELSVNRKHTF